MLTVSHLHVGVGEKKIIRDFSYSFETAKTYVIMGPNGSGKSTLAQTIMGHPQYTVDPQSRILFNRVNLVELDAQKRAQNGIYLSFQSPPTLQGVSVFQMMRSAQTKADVLRLKQKIDKLGVQLHMKDELLSRGLNEGASGGERKKMEVLQMAVLNPKLVIFDEVDTGVDVDSLKHIFSFLAQIKKKKTYIFITHYSRILQYVSPDRVLVMKEGRLQREGGADLIHSIEEHGYERI